MPASAQCIPTLLAEAFKSWQAQAQSGTQTDRRYGTLSCTGKVMQEFASLFSQQPLAQLFSCSVPFRSTSSTPASILKYFSRFWHRSRWSPDVICDDIPAGERVTWCIKNLGLSSEEARPPICIFVVSKSPSFVYCMLQWEVPLASFLFVRQRVMREYCANFGERAGITAAAWHATFAFGHAPRETTARKVSPFSAGLAAISTICIQ